MPTNLPVASRKFGNIEYAIWQNEAQRQDGPEKYLGVSITRSYKPGEEAWQEQTITPNINQLPDLELVAGDAYAWSRRNPPAQNDHTPPTTPVHSEKIGLLEVAVWENRSDQGRFYHTATVTRSYDANNGQGEPDWQKQTMHAHIADLPKLKAQAQGAFQAAYQEKSGVSRGAQAEAS